MLLPEMHANEAGGRQMDRSLSLRGNHRKIFTPIFKETKIFPWSENFKVLRDFVDCLCKLL